MKYTIVPAQVTTVEDRIAGSLGLAQLMLLITPLFFGSLLYLVLPPSGHNAPYKLTLISLVVVVCALSAIRIKGQLLLHWGVILVHYQLRARYYVFSKPSLAFREPDPYQPEPALAYELAPYKPTFAVPLQQLTTAELARVEALVNSPETNMAFETTGGGLRVSFTEIED